jgi:DUF4097 and DUF4098 domain-containing protein YvlB
MLEQNFHTPLPLELEVAIPAGSVEVETSDSEESSIVVDGDEQLLENVEIRHEENRLVVAMRGKSKFGFVVTFGSRVFGNAGLRVHAQVPNGAGVKIKTTSADTHIEGHVRTLDVNTTSGDTRVRADVAENAAVKTVSGDVELGPVGGNLTVQTVSGDLRADRIGGSVDTKSVSGDIRLGSLTAGDARFASVSGDVEIGIASGSLVDVDAGSTSGDLGSDVPLASQPPQGGEDPEPTVVVRGRTVSGDVRIFRAS